MGEDSCLTAGRHCHSHPDNSAGGDMHIGGGWQSTPLVTAQFLVDGYGLQKKPTSRNPWPRPQSLASDSGSHQGRPKSTIEGPVPLHLHTYYFFICINKFIAGLHHKLKAYFCFRHCNHHFVNIFNFACCKVFY